MSKTRAVTAEEFEARGEGTRELLFGRVVEMTPGSGDHGRISSWIGHRIQDFLGSTRAGVVFSADTGYILRRRPDLVRAPDVSFVSANRPAGVDTSRYIPLAPDLAVEVVSPGDRWRNVDTKARMWIGYGSRIVWVVVPRRRRVHGYRPGTARKEREPGDNLSGEDVLPGFALPVDECF
jgi:Uma2 family endonuclease